MPDIRAVYASAVVATDRALACAGLCLNRDSDTIADYLRANRFEPWEVPLIACPGILFHCSVALSISMTSIVFNGHFTYARNLAKSPFYIPSDTSPNVRRNRSIQESEQVGLYSLPLAHFDSTPSIRSCKK